MNLADITCENVISDSDKIKLINLLITLEFFPSTQDLIDLYEYAIKNSYIEVLKSSLEKKEHIKSNSILMGYLAKCSVYNNNTDALKYLCGFSIVLDNINVLQIGNGKVLGPLLKIAAEKNNLEIVGLLLNDYNADIHLDKDVALRTACLYEHPEMVKYLIDKGANVNAFFGLPLQNAVKKGNKQIVELLLDNGVLIHTNSFVSLLKAQNNKDILDLFINAISDKSDTAITIKVSNDGIPHINVIYCSDCGYGICKHYIGRIGVFFCDICNSDSVCEHYD